MERMGAQGEECDAGHEIAKEAFAGWSRVRRGTSIFLLERLRKGDSIGSRLGSRNVGGRQSTLVSGRDSTFQSRASGSISTGKP